jgi:hypothetical protein
MPNAMVKKILSAALLSSAAAFAACAGGSESANVDDACQKKDGTIVAVEGFLVLPELMDAAINPETELTSYELILAAQPDGKSAALKTAVSGTRSRKTNRIAELPAEGYTQNDLRIFTDTGEVVGSLDRVRITGQLSKARSKVESAPNGRGCVLKAEKIEKRAE